MLPIARCILAAALLITTFGLSATSAPASGTWRHVVVFHGEQAPPDFAQRVEALGGTVFSVLGDVGVAAVGGLTDAAAQQLRATPGILAIEPDLLLAAEVSGESADSDLVADAAGVSSQSAASPTMAASYARQWNLRAIEAEKAWAAGHLGSPEVSAFVLDTGIDYLHPDLVGRVDLSRSVSLVSSYSQEDALVASQFPGRHPITDLHSHGTAVAALIASNGKHLAGVTQRTTLVGVKVHDRFRQGPISVYLEGIIYAANNGADVIHLSIPVEFDKRERPGLVGAVNRAIDYAHRQGAVMVAAAGNAASDLDQDADRFRFCNAVHVLCVSATGPTSAAGVDGPWADVDAWASYTNFGRSAIDVAGPGGTTASGRNTMVWLVCSQVTRVTTAPQRPCREGQLIWSSTGTSFGAAATSGLAALLVSTMGKGKPNQIAAAIEQSSDDLGDSGTDPYYGKGRINVCQAVASLLPNGCE